jgi:hypothetical protein
MLLYLAIAGWKSSALMGAPGSAKRTRHIAVLPDELMHVIFSKLSFHNKIRAGLACKQWDQLLKAGTPAARHWNIDYIVQRTPTDPDATKQYRKNPSDHPSASIGRCALKLAASATGGRGSIQLDCRLAIRVVKHFQKIPS